MKGILKPTLKMILKAYYQAPVCSQQQEIPSCSQEEQLETSLGVQPDDIIVGRYRDVKHNPLERPQASEEEDKMIANDPSHVDQGEDFVFQTEVGMNLEASQVAARHFELAMFRQQQETTAKSIDREGDHPVQGDFAGNLKTATTAQVAAREDTALSRQQRGWHRLSRGSSLIQRDEG